MISNSAKGAVRKAILNSIKNIMEIFLSGFSGSENIFKVKHSRVAQAHRQIGIPCSFAPHILPGGRRSMGLNDHEHINVQRIVPFGDIFNFPASEKDFER